MEVMRSEEIDLTLDDDTQSDHCDEKSDSDIDVGKDDTIKEEINNTEVEGLNNLHVNNESEQEKNFVATDEKSLETEDNNSKNDNPIEISNNSLANEIHKLIKYQEKLEDGSYIYLHSCGPFQQQEKKMVRPINCHACCFTTTYLDEMKLHINSEKHKFNVSNISPEKSQQSVYNLYDSTPKEFKIMICLFGGDNIPEVHDENKNRLVYFCKTTNKLKLQKIVLNRANNDILNEINKKKPIFGLEYCIKFTNNYSYYCVLCSEHILKDPLCHFAGKTHINNFIVRHFLLTKNKIATLLRKLNNFNKEIDGDIFLEIYNILEKKHKLRKINIIEQKMFNCFRNYFIKIVCNHFHFSDNLVSQIEIKSLTNKYIDICKNVKSDLLYECDNNSELVLINDEPDNENSENIINEENNEVSLSKEETEENNEDIVFKVETEENISEDITIISDKNDIIQNIEEDEEEEKFRRDDEIIDFNFDEESSYIVEAEDNFKKLDVISDLEIFKDPICDEEAPIYWEKATFSLEYIVRFKYCDSNQEKLKCALCNKFLTNLIVPHTTSRMHRIQYINKHFPILKSYLKGCLNHLKFNKEKEDVIIAQMISEICQRLMKRTNKCLNQFFRVSCKKFSKSDFFNSYIEKCCSSKEHFDDKFFISVYNDKGERTTFLKGLIQRFFDYYNNSKSCKRLNTDSIDETLEIQNSKRIKMDESDNVPITLITVLKLIESSPELKEVNSETNRLLSHAVEMERVNGNITELMKSIEYLNFFKKIMEILKNAFECNDQNTLDERMIAINKILDRSTLLVESMEEGIESNELIISEVLTIDDDDEPEFISSTNTNDNLKKLPNPFSSKFKKPNGKSNNTNNIKTNQQQNYSSNFSNSRNIINNEIRVNNRNIGQTFVNLNRPNSSILGINTNMNRYNNNPVLNVTTYRETTQMNMSIPILGNNVNNPNSFRNVFVNNQQNHHHHHHRYQNTNLPQQQVNFSKAYTSYASRATSVQQSNISGGAPPAPSITQQSVRASILPPKGIPILLSNTQAQQTSSTAAAQNQIFNSRLNFRGQLSQPQRAPPPPQLPTFQHVSISNNSQVHNFNNIHGNTLSINQRFQAIRAPFSMNNTFPCAYANSRNLFAGRTHF